MNTYNTHTLANGLKLITVPMPGVETVTVLLMIGAGSRYESKKINGLSHFLEHMAFKGSKKRPSAFAISSEIDGIGGEFNAFTSKDHTGFYIKARSKHLALLVDVLSDMILNPLLKDAEIEKEKGVIIEEIHMYEDMPMRHIGDIYEELLYGDTPLGRDTAGKPEIIKSIMRGDFVKYMRGLYTPNNAVLTVAGGIGDPSTRPEKPDSLRTNSLQNLVENSLSSWKKGDTWQWQKSTAKQSKPALKLQYKKTEQAHIALGVPAFSMLDPRRYALNIISAILGGGMSSRLFTEVREKRGLAYYVHTSADQYLDVGSLTTQAGVDVGRIGDAISVIIDQYMQLAKGKLPITQVELTKAKEYINGRFSLELEDSRAVAGFFATQEILKRKIRTPDEVMKKTSDVTLDEVHKIARVIFEPKKLNLAIIGPYKEEEKFRKLLT